MSGRHAGKATGFVNKHIDGNRQRCISCGHPRKEHRNEGCSIPQCKCVDYAALASITPKAAQLEK
jgi:hypothetical protein